MAIVEVSLHLAGPLLLINPLHSRLRSPSKVFTRTGWQCSLRQLLRFTWIRLRIFKIMRYRQAGLNFSQTLQLEAADRFLNTFQIIPPLSNSIITLGTYLIRAVELGSCRQPNKTSHQLIPLHSHFWLSERDPYLWKRKRNSRVSYYMNLPVTTLASLNERRVSPTMGLLQVEPS